MLEGQVSGLGTVLPFSHLHLTSPAHGVLLSRDRFDIVKDNILCALYLPIFLHCFQWFRGNTGRPCGIASLNGGAPWIQK